MCIESDKILREQLRKRILKKDGTDESAKQEIDLIEEEVYEIHEESDEIYSIKETINEVFQIMEPLDEHEYQTNCEFVKNEQSKPPKVEKRGKSRSAVCEICGKFFSKNYIPYHRRTHQLEYERIFACKFLGIIQMMFVQQLLFSYVGDLCGLRFKLKCYVYSHMRNVHSSIKNWVCTVCGKGYAKVREGSSIDMRFYLTSSFPERYMGLSHADPLKRRSAKAN